MRRWLILLLAVSTGPAAVRAEPAPAPPPGVELHLAWWNDLFSELPPADDSGFTNDLVIGARWTRAGGEPWVWARHRMITEQAGGAGVAGVPRRRWDQLELSGGFDVRRSRGDTTLLAGARAGFSAGGNFGGLAIQDGWHRLTRSGATVEQGLQSEYDGGRRLAPVVGGAVELSHERGPWRPLVGADAQAALGSTGVSSVAGVGGLRVELPLRRVRLLLALELALARYATRDDNLALPGGYGTGAWQLEPRAGIGLGAGRYHFGWQYRANEGGSGEPTGVLWLRAKI